MPTPDTVVIGTLAATNAVSRTLAAWKAERPASPKDFGAIGDGVSNDTVAMQRWATYVSTNNQGYLSRGRYRVVDAVITISNGAAIIGDGMEFSEILFVATGTTPVGLRMNIPYSPAETRYGLFSNFGILIEGQNTGAMVHVQVSNNIEGNFQQACTFEKFQIKPNTLSSGYQYSIRMVNCTSAILSNVTIRSGDVPPLKSVYGIHYSGQFTVELRMSDVAVSLVDTALYISGTSEGVYCTRCAFVGVDKGLTWNAPAEGRPLLAFMQSHIASFTYGIYCLNVVESQVKNNLLYAVSSVYREGKANLRFDAIWFNSRHTVSGRQSFNQIEGNEVYTFGILFPGTPNYTPPSYSAVHCITIEGNTNSIEATSIGHNILTGGVGIQIAPDTNRVFVYDTNRFEGVSTRVADAGFDNIVSGTNGIGGQGNAFAETNNQGAKTISGNTVVAFDVAGNAILTLPEGVGVLRSAMLCNGDASSYGEKALTVNLASSTASALSVSARPAHGAPFNMRVNYEVKGKISTY